MRGGVEQKKEQKKEGLLEAAYQLFLEKGVNKTSVDEIVKKANVAKGTFYLYFHDKTQLLQQLTYRISARVLSEAYEYSAPESCTRVASPSSAFPFARKSSIRRTLSPFPRNSLETMIS